MVKSYCQKCGEEFFTWRYMLKNGWGKYCSKECQYASFRKPIEELRRNAVIRTQRWIKRHPEYKDNPLRKEYMSQWSQIKYYQLRDLVIKKYGGECSKCGMRDWRVLCIDHINGGGVNELKKISGLRYLRKVLADKSGKYQLLCQNCNWIKRWENREVKRKRVFLDDIVICACGCGKKLNKHDSRGRNRKYISGHNLRKL